MLVAKIIEEAQEITSAKAEDLAGEIANAQQALDDLKCKYKLTDKEVAVAQKAKLDKNGDFSKGIYVDYVEINENDKWVDYYHENADLYPDIE